MGNLFIKPKNYIEIRGFVGSMLCKENSTTLNIYNKDGSDRIDLTINKKIADDLYCKNIKISIEEIEED